MARNLLVSACALAATAALLAPTAHAAAPPGEQARIAALLAPTGAATGGGAGAYARPAGTAQPIVSVDAAAPFEPASAIKVLIAAAAERRIADYSAELTDDAYRYPTNKGPGEDGTAGDMCVSLVDERDPSNKRPGVTANLAQARMMIRSDNVLTRTMLRAVGDIPGLGSTIAAAGLTNTTWGQDEIGCGFSNGKRNTTTLEDLSRLWERVDTDRGFLPLARRDHLYTTMSAASDPDGWSTFGPGVPTDRLVTIVAEESKSLGVSQATTNWLWNGTERASKGGSYQIGCGVHAVECPTADGRLLRIRSLSGLQRFPYHEPRGADRSVTYLVGARNTRVCPGADADCATAVDTAMHTAYSESLRSVVRDSLLSKQYPNDAVPVARLAGPDTVVAGQPATFDASGSTDAEGPIARVDWAFGDGATARGATATHTFAAPGTYVVEAGAIDGVGKNDTARRTVTVVAPGATPTADPAPAPAPGAPAVPPATLTASAPKTVKRGKPLAVRVSTGAATRVTVRIQRTVAGRRTGQRCVAPVKGKRGKRCTRTVTVATTARTVTGTQTLAVPTRPLRPGTYRVVVSAPGAPTRRLTVRVRR